MTLDHVPALVTAAAASPDAYRWSWVPVREDHMLLYVTSALREQDDGTMLPFTTVRRADGEVVGSTRFSGIETWQWPPDAPGPAPREVDAAEIGYTWLRRDAQRSSINTEAKLLMLAHAFETWHCHRICLRTDERNIQSRTAIERLGAHLDGVMRGDRAGRDGTVRNSAQYSILASEWPPVKARLESLLR
jgi:RimJ/RimL family protein N-acetyltransferase